MADRQQPQAQSMGLYGKPKSGRVTAIEVIAIIVSLIWLVLCAAYFLVLDTDAGGPIASVSFMMIMLAVFMPVAMIWVAATAARSSKVMREESQRLQIAIDAIRNAYVSQSQSRGAVADTSITKKLEEIASAQRKTEMALATFTASRHMVEPPAKPKPAEQEAERSEQVSLPLGTTEEEFSIPLEAPEFIRALNFPENAEDTEGFSALRRALKDRPTAQLIQAAQDILTLMSHDGIYMDDLRPDLARPEIWRRFAAGERGRSIAQLGGIRDRSSLALSSARMKSDPIFRDAAHHFLRLFDRMIISFTETADDAEVTELSNTRTARAFMLLGRVTGTFD